MTDYFANNSLLKFTGFSSVKNYLFNGIRIMEIR